jgi:hypothetical protein
MHEGQKYNLPMDPNDACFFESEFIAKDTDGTEESFVPEVQQVKFWMEDPTTGEKVNKNGIMKIEYPENFFGKGKKIIL